MQHLETQKESENHFLEWYEKSRVPRFPIRPQDISQDISGNSFLGVSKRAPFHDPLRESTSMASTCSCSWSARRSAFASKETGCVAIEFHQFGWNYPTLR